MFWYVPPNYVPSFLRNIPLRYVREGSNNIDAYLRSIEGVGAIHHCVRYTNRRRVESSGRVPLSECAHLS